jgi:hypothetical protein
MILFWYLHFVHPSGKPIIPHLQRCQGFAVAYYGFTLDAFDLGHLRLSLNSGNKDVYFQQEEPLRAKCESGAEIGQSRVFGRGLNDQESRGATLGSWWRDIAIFQYNKMEKTK